MARTRYQRADQADSDCTPADGDNKPLLSSQTGGNETVTFSVPQTRSFNDGPVFAFVMAAGDPGGNEDLPAGSLFRVQLDVTALGASLIADVVFHALNASCVSQGSAGQVEANINSTGLHILTATWDPPIADRYAVYVRVQHEGMHSDPNETFTLRTNNSNAWFEIPDAESEVEIKRQEIGVP